MRTSLGTVSKYLPTNDDFEGAQRSLIRLQHTYHLRTTDLSNGKVIVWLVKLFVQLHKVLLDYNSGEHGVKVACQVCCKDE